ncbi:uncharacterized protein [Clytia hemisphaerica]|uniref:uncharacterized protein n=1 Tax=Clytia hemisphaerica TaxID=252671 RepID=UPI0034D4643E
MSSTLEDGIEDENEGEKKENVISEQWKKRRSTTTMIFYLTNLALGIEYSLTFATLYVYLKDVLHVKYLNTFYSAISGMYFLAQVLASLVLSKIFDKCRHLRIMFFIINVFTIVGNILYTIPLSPYLLLAGRFISGAGASIQPIMMSELTRSYPPDELIQKFSPMSLSYALGFTVGPCINFAFVNSNFWFLGIHIGFANGSGLVLTFLFMILLIISIIFVSDLSKEFDLKDATKNIEISDDEDEILYESSKENSALMKNIEISDDEDEILFESSKENCALMKNMEFSEEANEAFLDEEEDEILFENFKEDSALMCENKIADTITSPSSKDMSTIDATIRLFTNVETVLIFILAFNLYLAFIMFDCWIPMVIVDLLEWDIRYINNVLLFNGVILIAVFILVVYKPPGKTMLFKSTAGAFVSIAACYGCFLYFSLKIKHKYGLDVFIWACYSFGVASMELMDIFLMDTLAEMVPSEIQSYSESVRVTSARAGAAVGLFTAAFTFQYLLEFCLLCIGLTFVLMLFFILRRKQFQNPGSI